MNNVQDTSLTGVQRAAELTRNSVDDVLPGILRAYHEASLQDAEESAPRYGRA